jgi:tetratricopeptide (TPR) repeat protein
VIDIRAVVFLVVLALSLDMPAALRHPPEREAWLTLTSGEFRIHSNASERDVKRVARELTRMREALDTVTRLKVRSGVPVHVYLFRDDRSFGPYRDALLQQRNAAVGGFFVSTRDAKFILLPAGAETDQLIYHELTHYFLDNTASGLPLWFGEGMAEFYSTFEARGDDVRIGAPITDHVLALRERFLPLATLFAVDARSPEYNESSRRGLFYAQSWAFIHYLMQGGLERRQQLGTFATLSAQGKPPEEAFRLAFGTDYKAMEKELRLYVARPTMNYTKYSLDELKTVDLAAPQPMTRAAMLTALGTVLAVHDGTLADALAFFDEAVRLDASLADAHAGRGAVLQAMGRVPDAHAAFERAVLLDSKDPNVYAAYGATLLERMYESANRPGGVSPADRKKARELFERATRLDPGSARAWAGLGATYAADPGEDLEPGIAALEKSLTLGPSQDDVAVHLVRLYARAGRSDDARRLVDDVLANHRDPEVQREAREVLLLAEVSRAEELFRNGKEREALEIARSVHAATSDERLRAHLAAVIAGGERTAKVKEAIEQANSGKIAEALKILDELLLTMPDDEMKPHVVKLREDMARMKR